MESVTYVSYTCNLCKSLRRETKGADLVFSSLESQSSLGQHEPGHDHTCWCEIVIFCNVGSAGLLGSCDY